LPSGKSKFLYPPPRRGEEKFLSSDFFLLSSRQRRKAGPLKEPGFADPAMALAGDFD
jgi:hypothetical protein